LNNKKIVIIDSDIGNVGSVKRAIHNFGYQAIVSNRHEDISSATHLILPGVGSFDEGMKKIHDNKVADILIEMAKIKNVPILGICLGMHLLATKGYENNKETNGLNIIPGLVKKLKKNNEFKLPHIGWNEVLFKGENKIFKNILDNSDFYFIHSYEFICKDQSNNKGISNYYNKFTSVINHNNIYGVQFHPEKSLENGLQIIKNFLEI
jgi:imidazole glycerol-phosphate synthase subunit HisH